MSSEYPSAGSQVRQQVAVRVRRACNALQGRRHRLTGAAFTGAWWNCLHALGGLPRVGAWQAYGGEHFAAGAFVDVAHGNMYWM